MAEHADMGRGTQGSGKGIGQGELNFHKPRSRADDPDAWADAFASLRERLSTAEGVQGLIDWYERRRPGRK